MKIKIIFEIICVLVGVLARQTASAQGTTYFSNVEQPSTGSLAVGSDLWLALGFGTGGNAAGYTLDSVQLTMADASGSPDDFSVALYSGVSNGGTYPGVSLGTLSGSANPASASIYTFNAPSDLTLSPNTIYFVMISAGTPVANGAYELSYTSTFSYNTSGGWGVINDGEAASYLQSSDGSRPWSPYDQDIQFGLDATPAPEPAVLSLFAAGGLIFALFHRKRFSAA